MPDEVVDLGRGRRGGVGSARASFTPAPSLPILIYRERRSEAQKLRRGIWLSQFSSIIRRLKEIEIHSSYFLVETQGKRRPPTLETKAAQSISC